jgi:hypothetical protein
MLGTKIKIELLELNLTQNWLWEQLKKQGFPKLTRSYLGDMLQGKVTTTYAQVVFNRSLEIIEKEKGK